VIVRVWGARGSLSAPGPATVGYGGNTSCVEVEFADGTTLILDAGSGIRELGQRIAERDPGELHVCLTHLHLDHVEGLGFFAPLWRSGWQLRFWGPPSTTATLRERVQRYLSPPLFPVGLSEAPAEVVFEDAPREPWRLGSFLLMLGLLLLYILASETVGFIPIALVFLGALFLWLGVRPVMAIVTAVAATLVIHWFFSTLLRVPLPRGWLNSIL